MNMLKRKLFVLNLLFKYIEKEKVEHIIKHIIKRQK